jgi:hypothetical protein
MKAASTIAKLDGDGCDIPVADHRYIHRPGKIDM